MKIHTVRNTLGLSLLALFVALSAATCNGTSPTQTTEPMISPTRPQETSIPEAPTSTALVETETPVDPTLTSTEDATETPEATPSPTLPQTTNTPAVPTPTKIITDTPPAEPEIHIPAQSDWVDLGIIYEAGSEGEWDHYLWGGFAFSAVKKGDTYFLYYQGASDYRTGADETVLWRAIGVATSKDGINFTKYSSNPVLTWFPNNNGEEGAVSSGVTLGDTGEIILFYGANTEETRRTINADTRFASSSNGLNFVDQGIVLDHKDSSIWGYGDELFVVDAIYAQGQWIVYYIPNGTPESGKLGAAFGSQPRALDQSSAVLSGGKPISVWGTASHTLLDSNTYALVLNNVREKRTEIRLGSISNPAVLSEPVVVYRFDEVQQAHLLLDKEKDIWYMYYRDIENHYGVKVASATKESNRND